MAGIVDRCPSLTLLASSSRKITAHGPEAQFVRLLETRRPALGQQEKYLVFCSTAPRGGKRVLFFAAKPATVMGFVDLQAVSYIPVCVLWCTFFLQRGRHTFPAAPLQRTWCALTNGYICRHAGYCCYFRTVRLPDQMANA